MNESHKSTSFRKRFAPDNLSTAEERTMPGPRNWLINNREKGKENKKSPTTSQQQVVLILHTGNGKHVLVKNIVKA